MEEDHLTLFADVLLPLPLPGTFTYRVPFALNERVGRGQRVVVQFGPKKVYTGLIYRIHQKVPSGYIPKYILSVLDDLPLVNDKQSEHWDWIAEYYMCRPGEVMNAALPSGLKLASESTLLLHPDFGSDFGGLGEKEFLIAEALSIRQRLTLTEVASIVDQKKIIPLIKGMIEKNIIITEEDLKEKYKPRRELFLGLNPEFEGEERLKKVFEKLEKQAHKQLEALMQYMAVRAREAGSGGWVSRRMLLSVDGVSAAAVQGLITKKVFISAEREVSRLRDYPRTSDAGSIVFTDAQQKALDELQEGLKQKDVALLHGITASGKTELYIRLISDQISQGKQVLFLLPEIALTAQIINRLKKFFGPLVGVYHSRYSSGERVEVWNRVNAFSGEHPVGNPYQLVLGARSALFLPFSRLGLIIVDEEHDASYKQNEPAPRYHARDAAIVLARIHRAKVILGSATPSVESAFNAMQGKYALVRLNKRYTDVMLPVVEVADLKKETAGRRMRSHFSPALYNGIQKALARGEQVILFQNRRGFSTRIECRFCSWVPQCSHCDVSLVYHKQQNLLKCHYCGYSTRIPAECPACKSTHLETRGFGTERIEEETRMVFPGARIARMDLDSTRSKQAYQQIIADFEERRTDILIGTQMVTKGLDFDHVSVVGILNADNMLGFPDFRAHERSFQLMEQVSGRAGRRETRGLVVIQTWNPGHAVINHVLMHNFGAMLSEQLTQRKRFLYPPFTRLVQITLRHSDAEILQKAADILADDLRKKLGKRVLGPEYPLISRVRNLYLKNILIKLERSTGLPAQKNTIAETINIFGKSFTRVLVSVDVDPM